MFKGFINKPLQTVDLVTFTEEILNEKLHFLCSVYVRCIPKSLDIKWIIKNY